MNSEGTSNKVSVKEQSNLMPPTVIKAEVNLSRLPFFALTRKGLKKFKTQLIITETRSDEGIEFIWKITANPEYGYPSPFAKKVHRAVEYMLTQKGFPVPDNLDFSFYEIADVLEIKPSGRTCGDIKRALLSIVFAAIESKGAFCYLENGKKRWMEDYFNLYDRVIFVGETLSDGTIADRNRIYFNEEIEELIEPEEKEKGVKRKKQTQEEEVILPIAQELINRGITKSVAIDFAEYFPEEHIRDKIEMHDINKATGILTQNAAGWLREAITRDYKLSEEQKQKLERVEKIKAEEEVTSKLEEQAKEIQEQRLREALANFPSEEGWVSAKVGEHIKVREEFRKFDPTRPSFTEEEIEQYRQEYKEKFPQTDDERRNWLISNDDRCNLQKIISELSQQQEEKEEKLKETADERFPLNSIEDVLGEVARQRAEFEVEQKESEYD